LQRCRVRSGGLDIFCTATCAEQASSFGSTAAKISPRHYAPSVSPYCQLNAGDSVKHRIWYKLAVML
jgi:hypothetical protein